jgi:hypothetical protein
MEVGGNLPGSLIEEFLTTINDEFSNGYVPSESEMRSCKHTFSFDGHVNYGIPDDTKVFCEIHNLSYRISCEASGEYDADVTFWKPGMKSEIKLAGNQAGNAQVDAQEARLIMEVCLEVMEKGNDALPLFLNRADWLDDLIEKNAKRKVNLVKVLRKRLDCMIPEIPGLPPFSVKGKSV